MGNIPTLIIPISKNFPSFQMKEIVKQNHRQMKTHPTHKSVQESILEVSTIQQFMGLWKALLH